MCIRDRYINEVYDGEEIPTYTAIPREQQRAIVRYALELAPTFGWLDDVAYMEDVYKRQAWVYS